MVGSNSNLTEESKLEIENLSFENNNLRRLLEEKDEEIERLNEPDDDIEKLKCTIKDLQGKLKNYNDTNFFELKLNERHQIVTERFTNFVIILDQCKDFIKYKGTNNAIYYLNKKNIILLKIDAGKHMNIRR